LLDLFLPIISIGLFIASWSIYTLILGLTAVDTACLPARAGVHFILGSASSYCYLSLDGFGLILDCAAYRLVWLSSDSSWLGLSLI